VRCALGVLGVERVEVVRWCKDGHCKGRGFYW